MTWTKLGSEFFDDCAEAGLSDAAVRTHAEAIGYLYGQENFDLALKKSTMRRWSGSAQPEEAAVELVVAKFWTDSGNQWTVVHHADVIRQSLAAQIKKREDDKARAARKRGSGSRSDVGTDLGSDRGTDVPATQTDSQTSIQTAPSGAEVIDPVTGEVKGWPPVAAVAGSRPICTVDGCSTGLVAIEVGRGICSHHWRQQQKRSA